LLHATLVFQFESDGGSHIGGWVDTLPGAAMSKDDIAILKATLDANLIKHAVDGTGFRERVCGRLYIGLEEGRYDRRGACVGASYYGPDMMAINDKNLAFIIEAYDSFFTAYMDIIEARKDEPVTEEDIVAQDAMRKNWFEDQTFADPYAAQQITPYKVWSFTFLPPAVKF
jgi:coproporphyrinogen III oxidase